MTTASILRSVAQLVRRRSPTTMVHRQLIGLAPATTRSIGSLTNVFQGVDVEEGLLKKCSDRRQATVVTTIVLQGFDASALKALLPMVQQHFSGGEAKKIVEKHLASEVSIPVGTEVGLCANTKVTLKGFEDNDDVRTLAPCVEEHLDFSPVVGEGRVGNWKLSMAACFKSMKSKF